MLKTFRWLLFMQKAEVLSLPRWSYRISLLSWPLSSLATSLSTLRFLALLQTRGLACLWPGLLPPQKLRACSLCLAWSSPNLCGLLPMFFSFCSNVFCLVKSSLVSYLKMTKLTTPKLLCPSFFVFLLIVYHIWWTIHFNLSGLRSISMQEWKHQGFCSPPRK